MGLTNSKMLTTRCIADLRSGNMPYVRVTKDKLKSYVLNVLFIFEAAKLIKFID